LGADFSACRPRVVLVEATRPNSTTPSHHGWEPLLLEAGYLFACFDGLNRFYVRGEDAHLLERLHAPANVTDDFVPHADFRVREALHHERRELYKVVGELRANLERAYGDLGQVGRDRDGYLLLAQQKEGALL